MRMDTDCVGDGEFESKGSLSVLAIRLGPFSSTHDVQLASSLQVGGEDGGR